MSIWMLIVKSFSNFNVHLDYLFILFFYFSLSADFDSVYPVWGLNSVFPIASQLMAMLQAEDVAFWVALCQEKTGGGVVRDLFQIGNSLGIVLTDICIPSSATCFLTVGADDLRTSLHQFCMFLWVTK